MMSATLGAVSPTADELRLLKARLWELVQGDAVAGGTTRIYIEGDLKKETTAKFGASRTQVRRFMLTNKCLLWCQIAKKAPSHIKASLELKGRLDTGQFSVVQLAEKNKPYAFKVYNVEKQKTYVLHAADGEDLGAWIGAFRSAKIPVSEPAGEFIQPGYKANELEMDSATRLAIMSHVRDKGMSVDEATELAENMEAIARKEIKLVDGAAAPTDTSDGNGDDKAGSKTDSAGAAEGSDAGTSDDPAAASASNETSVAKPTLGNTDVETSAGADGSTSAGADGSTSVETDGSTPSQGTGSNGAPLGEEEECLGFELPGEK